MATQGKSEGQKRRLVIYLPEKTYKKMWHRAIDEDKSASAFVADLIERHLKAGEKPKRG